MTETNTQQSAHKPEDTKRQGAVEAAIWRNDGQHGAFHTVTIKRNYKDERDGQLKSTNSLRPKDLPDVQKLTSWAESRLEKLQDQDRGEERAR